TRSRPKRGFAMKPAPSVPSSATSLADRLETLAAIWEGASKVKATRPTPISDLDALRDDLNVLAEEAEAGDRSDLARALRRIALLCEVWECLGSEPAQEEASADVADFCLRAMIHLARDQRTGTGSHDEGICDGILRQSDELWSDYLGLLDPTSAGLRVADE